MASIDELSLEEKARLDEVIKRSQPSLKSEEVFNKCLAVIAEKECIDKAEEPKLGGTFITLPGDLINYTNGPLTVASEHRYAGYVEIDYPDPLNSGAYGTFTLGGKSDTGIEAAVVYGGKNKNNVDCGWLLAFGAKADQVHVYVVCGPIDRFSPVAWDKTKEKIEISGSWGLYNDKDTGTSIYASIYDYGNGWYYVSASFYG
uniref:Uncharacterized protein n=1 Tax=Leersia perrieri TaxID=77586 RepID=A0A0D9XUE7_9ORYZ